MLPRLAMKHQLKTKLGYKTLRGSEDMFWTKPVHAERLWDRKADGHDDSIMSHPHSLQPYYGRYNHTGLPSAEPKPLGWLVSGTRSAG